MIKHKKQHGETGKHQESSDTDSPNAAKWLEPARELPVSAAYDVIVCGAGPAGCAAALAASRYGCKTLIVEKYGYAGGATVSQFVMPVLSMNGVDLEGVWHEWMHTLAAMGGVSPLEANRGRKVDGSVDPELVKYAWEKMLQDANVDILYHVIVANTVVSNGKISGIVVETVRGREVISGKRVIDCTGDGIVCAMASVPWEQGGDDGICAMALTKPFRLGNTKKPDDMPSEKYDKMIDEGFSRAIENNEFTEPIVTTGSIVGNVKRWTRPLANRPEMLIGSSKVLNINPLDPWQLSRAEQMARKQIEQIRDFHLRYCPGCENAYFLDTSAHIGIRSTRRICGMERVTKSDALNFVKKIDSIAKSSWHIDIWPHDNYTQPANRSSDEWIAEVRRGNWFDIPFGCIIPVEVDNLLVAGRCISSDHWAQSSLRIQQTCQSTGQAAGTIAALSLKSNIVPRKLSPALAVHALKNDREKVKRYI